MFLVLITVSDIYNYLLKKIGLIYGRYTSFVIIGLLFTPSLINTVQAQNTPPPYNHEFTTGLNLYSHGLFPNAIDYFTIIDQEYNDPQLGEIAAFYRTKALSRLIPSQNSILFKEFVHTYPKSEKSGEVFLQLAGMAFQNNEYSSAIDYLNEGLNYELEPGEGAEAIYLKAEAYIEMNDLNSARKTYLEVANTYPDTPWAPRALYARGQLYLTENRYDNATEAFELLRSEYPNDEMTRRIGTALGESYYQQKRYEEAIEAFKDAMPYLEGEFESKATLLIAESANYLNRYDQASTYYLRYINQNKGTDKEKLAHYGLGWIYHKQNIYHWAAESFGKAVTDNDELSRKSMYYKAVNEKLGGRYQQAIETFREFGERYKKGLWIEQAYYEWAITAFEMGNFTEAVEVLLPLVRQSNQLNNPGDVLTLLGEAYFANGEYTRASQAFTEAEKSVNVPPSKKRQASFQKAWVMYRNQAYETAQPIFEQLYEENRNDKLAPQALFWSADSYYNIEEYGPASAQFQEFADQYPTHELRGPALYALGWSHFEMGRFRQAIDPLIEFLNNYEPPEIALFPYETDTQLRIGDAYYAVGEYEEAIKYYKMAVGAEPGGDYAMYQIANSYYRSDRTFEAVTTFRRFLRIYPYSRLSEQARYNIGYIYFLTGNYSQAIDEFHSVINKYPGTHWAARAQYNIGDAYYNAADYQKAVNEYEQVLNKYPRSDFIIDAINGIQFAQLASGKEDSSSVILEEFLQNHPQTSTADLLQFRQAETMMESGEYEKAIDAFKQYLRVTNNEDVIPEAYFNLADAYQQVGDSEKAHETYEIIIENYSGSDQAATSLAVLGKIYLEQGKYELALRQFEELKNKGRQYQVEAFNGMGEAELQRGNLSKARNHFNDALNIRASSDEARLGLALVDFNQNQYRKAESALKEIADNNVTGIGAKAQFYLALALQRQGLYQKALDEYAKVSVLYAAFREWVARSMFHSAECYIETGEKGQAVKSLSDLVNRYPEIAISERAEALLQELN